MVFRWSFISFFGNRAPRLVEVPIVFTERRAGETKMTLGIAAEAAWRVLHLRSLRNEIAMNLNLRSSGPSRIPARWARAEHIR